MSFISHAHATLATAALATSALPDAPVVPEPERSHWFPRLVVARSVRAARRLRTREHRWATAA